MKKLFLLGTMVCTLGMITAFNSRTVNKAKEDTTCIDNSIRPFMAIPDSASVEHKNVPTSIETVWEDVKISKAEFESAALVKEQYQNIRSDRKPDKIDSSIVSEWAKEIGDGDLKYFMEECGFYQFEGWGEIVELSLGDYCCTHAHNDTDTTCIPACWMSLSTDHLLAGYFTDVIYWDAPFEDAEGYVYFSHYDYTFDKLGKPYVYKTAPQWYPIGDSFWGADGWFFLEGWDKERNVEYHKIRPKTNK